VHILHPFENLLHVLADLIHPYILFFLLVLLNDLLKVGAAELKDQVLRCLSLLILRVVDVEELDHVLAVVQLVEDLILPAYILPRLSCPLDCHGLIVGFIVSFENIAFTKVKEGIGRGLPKLPEPMTLMGSRSRYSPLLLVLDDWLLLKVVEDAI